MFIEVLYEDDAIVAINKPAGLIVHADGRTSEPTVVEWLKGHVPGIAHVGEVMEDQSGEEIERTGIVHRLDRDTSGVLLLAKTSEAHAFLKEQFLNRTVKKVYRAFVYGSVTESRGVIDRPIARSKTDRRKWTAQNGRSGVEREAITYYKTLLQTRDVSYLELRPQTGRTHQIRVHLKAIHHPVLSDLLYAQGKESMLDFKRLALHALSIHCVLPSGEEKTIEAPLPDDFIHAEQKIGISHNEPLRT